MTGFNDPGRHRKSYFVMVCLSKETLAKGWPAFACVVQVLRDRKVTADQLVFIRHTETPVGVTSTWMLEGR